MKEMIICFGIVALLSCNSDKDKKAEPENPATTTANTPTDLPYKASYTSNWTTDVSDADLKTVLQSYKDWADGNMTALETAFADTVDVEMNSGDHLHNSKGDLMKFWGTYRDSLSSVTIDMEAWHKMYATDKKEGYIITWYKETDTYKTGKVDSARYHDINQVKDGKIVWYSQYKRPLK
ncbi:MAG: nuclear transport factor 2 family protein [Chitinophagaceae bacterium]|nr:nuclear transport factor 2 family protein [Chitinophagaceae bacterium]MBK8952663.1 nuclear transport factor 2 family protein [Chitinophagaceae bacterium]